MILYTPAEIAGKLRISRSKCYELIGSGALPVYRIGGAIRISEDDLIEYLRGCREIRMKPERHHSGRLKHLVVRQRA